MKAIAIELNKAKWTQPKIGAALGVDQQRVSEWLITNTGNGNGYKSSRHDARVTIPKDEHANIYDRYQSGETQEQIAADYGVTQPAIHKVVVMEAARCGSDPPNPGQLTHKRLDFLSLKVYDKGRNQTVTRLADGMLKASDQSPK